MKFLTIVFDKPVQNPLKTQGIYQATHSAPVDIQAEDNGRVTLTAPDGTRVVVHGIGWHGVPDLAHERLLRQKELGAIAHSLQGTADALKHVSAGGMDLSGPAAPKDQVATVPEAKPAFTPSPNPPKRGKKS